MLPTRSVNDSGLNNRFEDTAYYSNSPSHFLDSPGIFGSHQSLPLPSEIINYANLDTENDSIPPPHFMDSPGILGLDQALPLPSGVINYTNSPLFFTTLSGDNYDPDFQQDPGVHIGNPTTLASNPPVIDAIRLESNVVEKNQPIQLKSEAQANLDYSQNISIFSYFIPTGYFETKNISVLRSLTPHDHLQLSCIIQSLILIAKSQIEPANTFEFFRGQMQVFLETSQTITELLDKFILITPPPSTYLSTNSQNHSSLYLTPPIPPTSSLPISTDKLESGPIPISRKRYPTDQLQNQEIKRKPLLALPSASHKEVEPKANNSRSSAIPQTDSLILQCASKSINSCWFEEITSIKNINSNNLVLLNNTIPKLIERSMLFSVNLL